MEEVQGNLEFMTIDDYQASIGIITPNLMIIMISKIECLDVGDRKSRSAYIRYAFVFPENVVQRNLFEMALYEVFFFAGHELEHPNHHSFFWQIMIRVCGDLPAHSGHNATRGGQVLFLC